MAELRIHRQSVQVIVKRAAQSDLQMKLFRIGIEVLGGQTAVITPVTLPTGFKFFLMNWTKQWALTTRWRTSISSAHSTVAEERRGVLISRPQRIMDVRFTPVNPGEMDDMVPALKRMSVEPGVMPLFGDQAALTVAVGGATNTIFCDTTNKRYYPGAQIVIAKLETNGHSDGTFIARTISERFSDHLVLTNTVTNLVVGLCDIYPTMNVDFLLEPKLTYKNGHVAQVDITVEEIFGENSLGPWESGLPGGFQIFKGAPIWNFEHDWNKDLGVSFKREGARSAAGRGFVTDTRGTRARYKVDYNLLFERDDAIDYLRFFDSRRGRLNAFWHVDQEDIWSIASQSNGDTEVNITAIGDFTLFEAELDETEPGHLGIVMNDGTVHIEEVTGIDDESSTWEVTLASAIPSLDLSQVRRVARARLVRYVKDANSEQWVNTNSCSMSAELIELLDEKEVTL